MSLTAVMAFGDAGIFVGRHLSMTDDPSAADSRSREDKELVRRIRHGDRERFADLIERYQGHVGRIVGRRVPADRVSEMVHDVFVRAYVNLAQFSDTVPFEHWLAGIAVRACVDFWRARTREHIPASALSENHQRWIEHTLSLQSEHNFRDQIAKQEATDVLEWALNKLSPEHRAVLTLVHLDGYSLREAAQLLGSNVVNVKVRAFRARRALRAVLRETVVRRSDDA